MEGQTATAVPTDLEAATVTTCLVADDHRAVVKLLARALEERGMTMVGRVCDGKEALARILLAKPNVAVLDFDMPGLNGVEVTKRAALEAPETAIVIYTGCAEPALVHEALDSGARGLVQKEASLEEFLRAVETVSSGGVYVDPVLAGSLAKPDEAGGRPALTKREREVLRHLADGLKYEEIGKQLYLSPETVRSYVKGAVEKLGAETRTEAVAKAIRLGLIG
jgi:DNA-binding NarL/FixJ family response regulator